VVFDEFAEQIGVAPFIGHRERPGQDPCRYQCRPSHPCVGVDDPVPHRIHREGSGHLQLGRLRKFGRSVRGIGQRLGTQDAAQVVVEPRVLQPAVARPGVEELACLSSLLGRRVEPVSQEVDPAALQQDAVNVQWFLHLAPVPLGVAETLVGVIELVQRHGDQAEVQPAA
jgi:hypothetical protein